MDQIYANGLDKSRLKDREILSVYKSWMLIIYECCSANIWNHGFGVIKSFEFFHFTEH